MEKAFKKKMNRPKEEYEGEGLKEVNWYILHYILCYLSYNNFYYSYIQIAALFSIKVKPQKYCNQTLCTKIMRILQIY